MTFAFERLEVWQDAMAIAKQLYAVTRPFPSHEQFGLTSQIRRAAVSVSANIAEGKGRYHKKEFLPFLYNTSGSLYETVTLSKLALHLEYLSNDQHHQLVHAAQTIFSKLTGLINPLTSQRVLPSSLQPRASSVLLTNADPSSREPSASSHSAAPYTFRWTRCSGWPRPTG